MSRPDIRDIKRFYADGGYIKPKVTPAGNPAEAVQRVRAVAAGVPVLSQRTPQVASAAPGRRAAFGAGGYASDPRKWVELGSDFGQWLRRQVEPAPPIPPRPALEVYGQPTPV